MDTDQLKPDFLELALGCQAEKAIGRAGYISVEKNHERKLMAKMLAGNFRLN